MTRNAQPSAPATPDTIPARQVVSLLDYMEGRLMDMQRRQVEQQNALRDVQRVIQSVRGKAA